jgi:hypothetical protein
LGVFLGNFSRLSANPQVTKSSGADFAEADTLALTVLH